MTAPNRLTEFFDTYTRDLKAEDLQRLFTRDAREAYKFVTRGIDHYQEIIEGLLARNIGIEKYFSYIVIKTPFIKNFYPIERLMQPPE